MLDRKLFPRTDAVLHRRKQPGLFCVPLRSSKGYDRKGPGSNSRSSFHASKLLSFRGLKLSETL